MGSSLRSSLRRELAPKFEIAKNWLSLRRLRQFFAASPQRAHSSMASQRTPQPGDDEWFLSNTPTARVGERGARSSRSTATPEQQKEFELVKQHGAVVGECKTCCCRIRAHDVKEGDAVRGPPQARAPTPEARLVAPLLVAPPPVLTYCALSPLQ